LPRGRDRSDEVERHREVEEKKISGMRSSPMMLKKKILVVATEAAAAIRQRLNPSATQRRVVIGTSFQKMALTEVRAAQMSSGVEIPRIGNRL
jgi:hypothetical protein